MGIFSERVVAAWAEPILEDRLNDFEDPERRSFQGVLKSYRVSHAFVEFKLLERNDDSVYLYQQRQIDFHVCYWSQGYGRRSGGPLPDAMIGHIPFLDGYLYPIASIDSLVVQQFVELLDRRIYDLGFDVLFGGSIHVKKRPRERPFV